MHIIKEEGSVSAKREDGRHEGEVSCAQVSILQESCSLTGVGEAECALSIVPVKIKSKKSDKYVTTYAFLDPGSTATFCTEELQRKLNIKGKPTRILLSTMGQDKPGEQKLMNSFVISDLEVCGLEETLFIELPKVFTHSNIPVYTGNIPEQSDIQKWSYLNEEPALCGHWGHLPDNARLMACLSRLLTDRRVDRSSAPPDVKHFSQRCPLTSYPLGNSTVATETYTYSDTRLRGDGAVAQGISTVATETYTYSDTQTSAKLPHMKSAANSARAAGFYFPGPRSQGHGGQRVEITGRPDQFPGSHVNAHLVGAQARQGPHHPTHNTDD
ncbi:hypothetical protein DPEC_G00340460 [Dallia pectoralis]|uniref:Uncharacterized protein n=1 Tax=Dallia pectoralis TaxID=75939 RepID=A0ACC2F579_DALPE|nr:hypothetical protein DPEC_G00340460 [Dallia pectoralis]